MTYPQQHITVTSSGALVQTHNSSPDHDRILIDFPGRHLLEENIEISDRFRFVTELRSRDLSREGERDDHRDKMEGNRSILNRTQTQINGATHIVSICKICPNPRTHNFQLIKF
jgi:hypothetical protein